MSVVSNPVLTSRVVWRMCNRASTVTVITNAVRWRRKRLVVWSLWKSLCMRS